jgi:two-component system response regulator
MIKKILLVEDNADDIELARRAFKKSRVLNELIVARDGEEALELLHGDTRIAPAVVLLDLKLPKIDGLEVLRRIRADVRTKLYPVVILTSSREDRDLIMGYTTGANSYMLKPVDFEKFIEAVQYLGLYWLVLNEPPPENA